MNIFQNCLRRQLKDHPSMEPRDVVKLCYQAACGAEHLLSDLEGAKRFFDEEFAAVPPREEPVFERISEHVCRVNLGAWKQKGLPGDDLFRIFAETVFKTDGKQKLMKYLTAAEAVLQETDFDMAAWQAYVSEYKIAGMPPVRHSERYRTCEKPAYRIVSIECLNMD